jgi:hypothetical protein
MFGQDGRRDSLSQRLVKLSDQPANAHISFYPARHNSKGDTRAGPNQTRSRSEIGGKTIHEGGQTAIPVSHDRQCYKINGDSAAGSDDFNTVSFWRSAE